MPTNEQGTRPWYLFEKSVAGRRRAARSPDRNGGEGPPVDVRELLQHHGRGGEDAVGVQEGVQEVNAQEPQVREPLQEALNARVADLGDFAGIQRFAEANINVISVKTGIGSTQKLNLKHFTNE